MSVDVARPTCRAGGTHPAVTRDRRPGRHRAIRRRGNVPAAAPNGRAVRQAIRPAGPHVAADLVLPVPAKPESRAQVAGPRPGTSRPRCPPGRPRPHGPTGPRAAYGASRPATATPTCRRSPSPPSSSTVATTSFLATVNSFIPQQNLPDAQLILYPDSGQIRPFIPQEKTMTRPAVSHAPGGHHPRQRPGYPIPAALVSPGPRTQDRQEPPAPGSHHQPDRGRDQPVARPRRHPPTRLRTRRPAPVDHVKDPDRTG